MWLATSPRNVLFSFHTLLVFCTTHASLSLQFHIVQYFTTLPMPHIQLCLQLKYVSRLHVKACIMRYGLNLCTHQQDDVVKHVSEICIKTLSYAQAAMATLVLLSLYCSSTQVQESETLHMHNRYLPSAPMHSSSSICAASNV